MRLRVDHGRAPSRGEAMTHRYQLGAQVRLNRGFPHRNAPDGPYEVVRQLPSASDGEHQYRIKHASEHCERVAKECDLERA
jgi:hypothetical protein